MLKEALAILAPLKNARSYAIALQYLGDLSLDQRDFRGALDAFRQARSRADALDQADFRSIARRGQAHALSASWGAPAKRWPWPPKRRRHGADQANPQNQIAALRVMALVHAQHTGLPRRAA
jgi:hypothetical protein